MVTQREEDVAQRNKEIVREYDVAQRNKEIVREYVEAILGNRDFSQFDKFAAPGLTIDRSAMPEALKGAGGLSKQMDMLYSAFPDLKFTIADMVAERDRVVVRFEAPGTHMGEYAGIAPTERQVMWKGIIMYRLEDGKIAQGWSNFDDLGLIQSLQ
jgi:steroid delta-isomerase-like uncharacterized protein